MVRRRKMRIRTRVFTASLGVMLVLAFPVGPPAHSRGTMHSPGSPTHSGKVVSAGFGSTPILDGVIAEGEWDDAGVAVVSAPWGDTTFHLKHNGSALWAAIRSEDATIDVLDRIDWYLDTRDSGDGVPQPWFHWYSFFRQDFVRQHLGTSGGWAPTTPEFTHAWTDHPWGWVYELYIPFTVLEITPGENRTLGCDFYIHDESRGALAGVAWTFTQNPRDSSTWGDLESLDAWTPGFAADLRGPLAGEHLFIGETREIAWTVTGGLPPYRVDIFVSRDGGTAWTEVAAGVDQHGAGWSSYPWNVTPPATPHGRLMVRVNDSIGSTAVSSSQGDISISESLHVQVHTPLAGAYILANDTMDVNWTVTGGSGSGNWTLSFSGEGAGGPWTHMNNGTLPSRGCTWVVPPVRTEHAILQLEVVDDAAGVSTALSPGEFTIAFRDVTPPVVVSTRPGNDERDVPVSALIIVEFSEPMDPRTTVSAIQVTPGSPLAPRWDDNGRILSLIPAAPFPADENITVTVGTGASDLAGNHLPSEHVWRFHTTGKDTPDGPVHPSEEGGVWWVWPLILAVGVFSGCGLLFAYRLRRGRSPRRPYLREGYGHPPYHWP